MPGNSGRANRPYSRRRRDRHASFDETVGKAEAPSRESGVVRRGGVAESDAETEDVTRDTYGFPSSAPVQPTPEERLANAEREAEKMGIPGIEIPESRAEVEERAQRPESSPKPERD